MTAELVGLLRRIYFNDFDAHRGYDLPNPQYTDEVPF